MADPDRIEEREVLDRLRVGDEAAFARLVEDWSPAMLHVARGYVPAAAVAEEVVQETWLGVLRGLDRFEGRSSLRTYAFRILVNRARTSGEREHRTVPFATLAARDTAQASSAVDPDRLLPAGHEHRPQHWAAPLARPDASPERHVESRETRAAVDAAIAALPERQRLVITMRDVAGFDAGETCRVLAISDGNQRVLLHRARARVRAALEAHLAA